MSKIKQNGYVLYTVIVMLVIVAAIALLVSNDSSFRSGVPERDLEAARADYVVQAALQHAVWRKDSYNCTGDDTIPDTSFGIHKYRATIDSAATAVSRTLFPDRDAWIRESAPNDNFGGDAVLAVKNQAGDNLRALYHYDLSSIVGSGGVQSAKAWFYVSSNDDQAAVDIFSVTADWTENAVTWSNIANSVDSSRMGTIPPQMTNGVWVSVDITALAQQWLNDPSSNHGITLIAVSDNKESKYSSREYGSVEKPYLEITTAVGEVSPVTISATGTLASGVTRTLTRTDVPAYKSPVISVLKPDSVKGIDTYISEFSPNTNYGTSKDLWISSDSGNTRLSLLKFELGAIPTGVRVLSAKLSVKQTSTSDSSIPVTAHRIYSPWNEYFATWYQRDDGVSWISPGGDFDATVIASTEIGEPAIGRFEWDIAELVEGWLKGTYANHGLALRTVAPTITGSKLDTSDHGDNKRYPILTIEYACECGAACMAPRGSGRILMVIGDSPVSPSAGDGVLRERFEDWGYSVSYIQDEDSQANFDAAVVLHDAAFISTSVDSLDLGSKLETVVIGVVNAKGEMNNSMGIADGAAWPVGDRIEIVDASHYITSVFAPGPVIINRGSMEGLTTSGVEAPGAQRLADWGGSGALLVLNSGDGLTKGEKATGRRVMIPLGREGNIHLDYWTNSGSLIVQRALAWATDADVAGRRLLMVVDNSDDLKPEDQAKVSLFESWGYSVRFIRANQSQADFNDALLINDVVFVSEQISSSQIGNKLTAAEIGIVTEEPSLENELGFSTNHSWSSGTELTIDNSHFVSSSLPGGQVGVYTTSDDLSNLTGTIAPQIQSIGTLAGSMGLAALETGAQTINGTAAGRRVYLPWGVSNLDVNDLTEQGLTLFERAIEWAADSSGTRTSTFFLSADKDVALGGLSFTDVDIAAYRPWSDTASLFFDGGSTTLNSDIDALHILANGNLLLSPKGNTTLGGLNIKKGDLVNYDPATDNATMIFEGKILFGDDKAKLTSVHLLDNGHLVLSTDKAQTLGGLSFTDRDLVEYDPATDTATLFFDGSTTTLNNKITGLHVLPNGHLVLSTKGNTTLGGLSFGAEDLIEYDPVFDTAELIFDGSALLSVPDEKIISVHFGPASGSISAPGSCDETFRDEFNAISFSGNDGTRDWTDNWGDVGENDGPDAGDIQVLKDESDYQLRFKDNDNGGSGVWREADLSGAASATLSYVYRRDLNGSADYTKVEVRDGNTATPWTELTRHQGPANDGSYQSASHDISSYISDRTQIRILTSPDMGKNEEVFFDNIQILCAP